jgi:hypothetical protein
VGKKPKDQSDELDRQRCEIFLKQQLVKKLEQEVRSLNSRLHNALKESNGLKWKVRDLELENKELRFELRSTNNFS